MQVRQAGPADIPLLLPLVAQYWAFEHIQGFESDQVSAALGLLLAQSQRGFGYIALAEGQAVGYVLVVYVFSLEHKGLTAEVDELFVLPAWRGQHTGRDLLMAAEAECLLAACSNISLQLAQGNAAARAFYQRRGYAPRIGFDLLEKDLPA